MTMKFDLVPGKCTEETCILLSLDFTYCGSTNEFMDLTGGFLIIFVTPYDNYHNEIFENLEFVQDI